VNLYSALSKNL